MKLVRACEVVQNQLDTLTKQLEQVIILNNPNRPDNNPNNSKNLLDTLTKQLEEVIRAIRVIRVIRAIRAIRVIRVSVNNSDISSTSITYNNPDTKP